MQFWMKNCLSQIGIIIKQMSILIFNDDRHDRSEVKLQVVIVDGYLFQQLLN